MKLLEQAINEFKKHGVNEIKEAFPDFNVPDSSYSLKTKTKNLFVKVSDIDKCNSLHGFDWKAFSEKVNSKQSFITQKSTNYVSAYLILNYAKIRLNRKDKARQKASKIETREILDETRRLADITIASIFYLLYEQKGIKYKHNFEDLFHAYTVKNGIGYFDYKMLNKMSSGLVSIPISAPDIVEGNRFFYSIDHLNIDLP